MARVLCVLLHNLEKLPPQAGVGNETFLAKLVRWAYRFSPIVSLDLLHQKSDSSRALVQRESCYLPEYWYARFGTCVGLQLDITGTERLFRGERRLLARIAAELRQHSIECRLAIAPTLGCAWAISRFAALNSKTDERIAEIVQPNGLRKAIETLPLEALRVSSKTINQAHALNLRYLKEALALPRSELHQAFGEELPRRLNQALGVQQEVSCSVTFAPLKKANRVFESPLTDREALLSHVRQLLEQALQTVDISLLKVSRIVLEVKEVGKPRLHKEILFSLPTNDRKHLWGIVKARVERIELCAGIESAAVYVTATEPFASTNASFLPPSASTSAYPLQHVPFAQMIESLSEQLGKKHVLYLEPTATHIPEQVTRYIPATGIPPQPNSQTAQLQLLEAQLVQTDRPSVLFYQPYPISTMAVLPDAPPFWLKWKDTTYRIITGIGPERIEPEWWGTDAGLMLSRDYFKVQLPCGTWLWIFREIAHSTWFLHGIWV